jgi:hypothetical protein
LQTNLRPGTIREAVPAGIRAWHDASVVVIQAQKGIAGREFGRFRRQGIPFSTVQGLRQQGFRGRSDGKSREAPRRKASPVSKPSRVDGEVVLFKTVPFATVDFCKNMSSCIFAVLQKRHFLQKKQTRQNSLGTNSFLIKINSLAIIM